MKYYCRKPDGTDELTSLTYHEKSYECRKQHGKKEITKIKEKMEMASGIHDYMRYSSVLESTRLAMTLLCNHRAYYWKEEFFEDKLYCAICHCELHQASKYTF